MELTAGIASVFALILLAAVLFATEWIPAEIAALTVTVLLVVLEPLTGVTPREAISGLSSPAVITVLAMSIVSEGVRRTGVVKRLGNRIIPLTRGTERRQLGATLALAGPVAGFVNNTPVVAVLVPVVVDLAKRNRISPSKLLMPLSFVSMMGGMLTLIGTSTNLLAADLSRLLLDRRISMFEFTGLGLVVLGVGSLYLLTLGRRLVPERIRPEADLTEKFRMRDYLSRVRVPEGSPPPRTSSACPGSRSTTAPSSTTGTRCWRSAWRRIPSSPGRR